MWFSYDEIYEDWHFAVGLGRMRSEISIPAGFTLRDLKQSCGCIVGKVDIIDCVERSNSPWFFGQYGFVLANPVAFAEPIPWRGALGFFNVPDGIERQHTLKGEIDGNGAPAAVPVVGMQERINGTSTILQRSMSGSRLESSSPKK